MTILNINTEITKLRSQLVTAKNNNSHLEVARLQGEINTLNELLCLSEEVSPEVIEANTNEVVTVDTLLNKYRSELGITGDNTSSDEALPGIKQSSYQELCALLKNLKEQRTQIGELDNKIDEVVENCLPETESIATSATCPADYKQMLISNSDKDKIINFYHKMVHLKQDLERQL